MKGTMGVCYIINLNWIDKSTAALSTFYIVRTCVANNLNVSNLYVSHHHQSLRKPLNATIPTFHEQLHMSTDT